MQKSEKAALIAMPTQTDAGMLATAEQRQAIEAACTDLESSNPEPNLTHHLI